MQRLLPLLFLLLITGSLAAQNPDLDDNSVTIITSFEANLTDAERVIVAPTPPAADSTRRRLQYNIQPRPLDIDYPAPIIRPRGLAREKADETYGGYAQLGVGAPNQFFADLSYDLVGQDNIDLGLYANHYSFNNDDNVENQKFSDTEIGIAGSYLFDQGFAVAGGASFNTVSNYYYGYNFPDGSDTTELSFDDDEVRQRFNIVDVNASIFNGTRTEADFDYSAGADIYLMDGNGAIRENGVDLTVKATKWFGDNPLDVTLRTDFTAYRDTSTQNLNNVYLNPSYTFTFDDIARIKIGANFTSQDDDFDVFPDVSASATIVDGVLAVFAGADGTLQKNNLRSLLEYNPWIRTRLRIRNSEFWRAFGGVEGNIYGVAYRAEASYKQVDNLALFNVDRRFGAEIPQFLVNYDDGNITTIQGTVTYPLIENLDLNATVAQRFYNLEDEEKAWHLPSTSLNAAGIYTLANYNLSFRADFFLENGLPYINDEGEADNLNALADLSLSSEYEFGKRFGAWVRVNNLLNNKRERFFRYPTIGTNVLAGVSAKF